MEERREGKGRGGDDSQVVEALTGIRTMDVPATVAVLLPIWRVRLGRLAVQGVSLGE